MGGAGSAWNRLRYPLAAGHSVMGRLEPAAPPSCLAGQRYRLTRLCRARLHQSLADYTFRMGQPTLRRVSCRNLSLLNACGTGAASCRAWCAGLSAAPRRSASHACTQAHTSKQQDSQAKTRHARRACAESTAHGNCTLHREYASASMATPPLSGLQAAG